MSVSIHEHEAVVAEREALRRQVDALRREVGRIIAEQSRDITKALRQQLAASQATNEKLREALSMHIHLVERNAPQLSGKAHGFAKQALALPTDTTALQVMIAKAGEVMRERAIAAASAINPIYGSGAAIDAISTVRIVTLDDLRAGEQDG